MDAKALWLQKFKQFFQRKPTSKTANTQKMVCRLFFQSGSSHPLKRRACVLRSSLMRFAVSQALWLETKSTVWLAVEPPVFQKIKAGVSSLESTVACP